MQHDIIMTKEQSVLTRIMKIFASKKNIAITLLFWAMKLIYIFLSINYQ